MRKTEAKKKEKTSDAIETLDRMMGADPEMHRLCSVRGVPFVDVATTSFDVIRLPDANSPAHVWILMNRADLSASEKPAEANAKQAAD